MDGTRVSDQVSCVTVGHEAQIIYVLFVLVDVCLSPRAKKTIRLIHTKVITVKLHQRDKAGMII